MDRTCVMHNFILQLQTKEKIQFNKKEDKAYGMEDYGYERTSKVANKHLVVLMKILATGEKLPLSFAATADAANSAQLQRTIKNHVRLLTSLGFRVVVSTCDQGGPNLSAIHNLIIDSNMERIKRDGEKAKIRE